MCVCPATVDSGPSNCTLYGDSIAAQGATLSAAGLYEVERVARSITPVSLHQGQCICRACDPKPLCEIGETNPAPG